MDAFIDKLSRRIQHPLPGLPAQLEMAPPARGQGEIIVPDDARKSAVLVLLYPFGNEPHVVFMKRSDDGHVHSGQISFPGGKMEEEDEHEIHTALRETEEEIGVPNHQIHVLGRLSDMYIPPSNFLVHPVLGFAKSRPDFVPDPVEVARVIEVPLTKFEEEGIRAVRAIEQRTRWGHYRSEAPSFLIGQDMIWGATSMILNELLTIARELD